MLDTALCRVAVVALRCAGAAALGPLPPNGRFHPPCRHFAVAAATAANKAIAGANRRDLIGTVLRYRLRVLVC